MDVVGEFEQADGLAVADQDALHAQATLAAGGPDAGGERRGGAEFAVGGDQQVGEFPAGLVQPGDRALERSADVGAAAEALAEEAGEPADAIGIDAELHLHHLIGPAEGIHPAGPALGVGAARRLEHHGLGHRLGAALHRARGIHAHQHRSLLQAPVRRRAQAGTQHRGRAQAVLLQVVVVLVGEQRALGAARVPDQAQARMAEQHRLGWQHACDPARALHAARLAGQVGHPHAARHAALHLGLLDHRLQRLARLRDFVGWAGAAKRAQDAGELGQALDQRADAHHLAPFGAAQQAAQRVPAGVLEQVAEIAEGTDELVDLAAALGPVGGEGLYRPRPRLGLGVAAIAVVDDQVEMEEQALQHGIDQLGTVGAVGGQLETPEDRSHDLLQGRLGPGG
ncbi:hypothetical protein MASR2M50_20580 [Thauera sp.]